MATVTSPGLAAWKGTAIATCESSGRAAAFESACIAAAREIGARVAAESRQAPLARRYGFGDRAGAEMVAMWLRLGFVGLRRLDSCVGGEYACELELSGPEPDLATLRRDLLRPEVLSDRRVHPLVLRELASTTEESEAVIEAFVGRLASPVLTDYFLFGRVTAFSPSASMEYRRHPELADELPPPMLLRQLSLLPGDARLMIALQNAATAAGRTQTARWIGTLPRNDGNDLPVRLARRLPHLFARSRLAREFGTRALTRLYAGRKVFPVGSVRHPSDPDFAEAESLVAAGLHREAYAAYLRSADLELSNAACLGAADCAAKLEGMDAESLFFRLQAVVIDPGRPLTWLALADHALRLVEAGEFDAEDVIGEADFCLDRAEAALVERTSDGAGERLQQLRKRRNELGHDGK